jgi:hypothetical protein
VNKQVPSSVLVESALTNVPSSVLVESASTNVPLIASGILKPPGSQSKNIRKVLHLSKPEYKSYRVSIKLLST